MPVDNDRNSSNNSNSTCNSNRGHNHNVHGENMQMTTQRQRLTVEVESLLQSVVHRKKVQVLCSWVAFAQTTAKRVNGQGNAARTVAGM